MGARARRCGAFACIVEECTNISDFISLMFVVCGWSAVFEKPRSSYQSCPPARSVSSNIFQFSDWVQQAATGGMTDIVIVYIYSRGWLGRLVRPEEFGVAQDFASPPSPKACTCNSSYPPPKHCTSSWKREFCLAALAIALTDGVYPM